ncbi:MAG: glycosyltransferase family 4 protein [Actinomycetota bacterium]|nr:glycosyltransferase family 4 protein [Actinomycetota bacterium]
MRWAFVLVSYRRDAPAGMERSTAALVQGLRLAGHEAFVVAAGPAPDDPADEVVHLSSLRLPKAIHDEGLREAIAHSAGLTAELREVTSTCDVVVWVDALWGLGAYAPPIDARSVLMVHVLGSALADLERALARRPDVVIAPSGAVKQSAARQLQPKTWRVVPNALLEPTIERPSLRRRRRLREEGPVRIVARLGPEKGVAPFLRVAAKRTDRHIEVALGDAGFELDGGSQDAVRRECVDLARGHSNVRIRDPLAWEEVPAFFADAALAVVPSCRESFGLVALEAMSAGTPIVCFGVENLRVLPSGAGMIVEPAAGPSGLADAMNAMLADPDAYIAAARQARATALRYRARAIADRFLAAAT